MGDAGRRCLAPGCGNPFLVRHELGPDEAVALCLSHRDQAVADAVPADRLRALDRSRRDPSQPMPPPAAWRQRPFLVRVAGNFFYETPVVFQLGSVTCVGFSRDEDHALQLDLRMPTASGRSRARITANVWDEPPPGTDLACPRSGRLVDISYPGGDRFRADFTEVHSDRVLQHRFGSVARWAYRLRYPVTLVQITVAVANTDLHFGPDDSCMGGPTTVDCFTSHGGPAIHIPITADQERGLFPRP